MALFTLANWPLLFVCAAMVLAAVIDGWKFKVPNWLTLPLVLSGWGIGLLHDANFAAGPGPIAENFALDTPLGGGFTAALFGTAIGFAMLFPALFIGGMGQGDVKMQMGFGAWVGAIYGGHEGAWTTVLAVCCGMIAGGIIAVIMMLIRGELHKNSKNFQEIITDFKVL